MYQCCLRREPEFQPWGSVLPLTLAIPLPIWANSVVYCICLVGTGHWDGPEGAVLKPSSLQKMQWRAGAGRRVTMPGIHSRLCFSQIQHTEDMENEIDELLQEFEEKSGRAFLHTVCFY